VRHGRGFSLLELVIVIVIISLLLTFAIDRLLLLRVEAERVAMQQTLGSLRSGLSIGVAELISRGRPMDAAKSVGSNPMNRLAEKPDNYLGELYGPDPAALEPGSWYFDSRDRVLVYLVRNAEYFSSPLPGPARARFAIRPDFDDRNGNGRYDPAVDELRGLRLAALEPFSWNDGASRAVLDTFKGAGPQ